MKAIRIIAGISAVAATMLQAGGAAAQAVPTCEALTLYGNAANEGLCKSLSPATQNLWVCDFTGGSPDIHATFNATTPLHITVRENPAPPGCQGTSTLTGNFMGPPNNTLTIAGGQPAMVCGVDVDNSYVARLNAVTRLPGGTTTACRAAFIAAQTAGKIDPTTATSYLNKCNAPAPAAPACP